MCEDSQIKVHMFLTALFMSYATALLVSLAFELPMMHFDKLLFGGGGGGGRSSSGSGISQAKNAGGKKVAEILFDEEEDPEENGDAEIPAEEKRRRNSSKTQQLESKLNGDSLNPTVPTEVKPLVGKSRGFKAGEKKSVGIEEEEIVVDPPPKL
jgi:hypothetical protein